MNKKIKIWILALLLATSIGGFKQSSAFEIDVSNLESTYHFINTINAQLVEGKNEETSKKILIDTFCKVVTDEKNHNNFSSTHRVYDSKQSIFLYLICNNQSLDNKDRFSKNLGTKTDQYLKRMDFKSLGYEDFCPKEYKENCNLPLIMHQLLAEILDELFTLQQARTIWLTLDPSDKEALREKMDALAYENFLIHWFCTDQTHNYPQTCNIREGHIRGFNNVIKNLTILKSKPLLEKAKDKKKGEALTICDTEKARDQYDIILCGTLWETEKWLKPFINTIYNEVLRYQLFLSYYSQFLQKTTDNMTTLYTQEANQIPKNLNIVYKSIHDSISDLSDFHNSYMIHIGLLGYEEDLLRLRNRSLSKIVTPFYNLYEKLRNVQKQDE